MSSNLISSEFLKKQAPSTPAPSGGSTSNAGTSNNSVAATSTQQSSLPIWLQMESYNDAYNKSSDEITNEDVSNALNRVVAFELSEAGKANTLFYSKNYNQGFTSNGKVVNGSCTEAGMRKAIVGGSKYITVTDSNGETKSGVEAMADSYDSVLDLYTQAQFQKVLEEYGYGTFTNNCNFIKHVDEIREKYGIDIKIVETQNADGSRAVAGIQNRTFEISMVDEDGKIIEDADGNKSTILFGDWVIPDGCAQGAEFDFISVIDQAGFDCVSKSDFIDNPAFASNPEFQDENGNYDAGKAYAYVLGQIENEFSNVKDGGASSIMQASSQTINEATYKGCGFTWWSAGGDAQYSANSGLNSSLVGGLSSTELAAIDLNGDHEISEEEAAAAGITLSTDEELNEKGEKVKNETAQQASSDTESTATVADAETATIADKYVNELEDIIAQAQEENPDADIDEIIEDYAQDNNLDEDALADAL